MTRIHRLIAIAIAIASLAATTTTTSTAEAISRRPNAPTNARRLVFAEEFSSKKLKWATCYPWWPATSSGCTNEGNADERQWYVRSGVSVRSGTARLTAIDSGAPVVGTFRGAPRSYDYTSGMIQSRDRFSFTYGYAEFRMKVASGNGMWDAAWLLPTDWRHRGEIDVFEHYGQWPSGLALSYHTPTGTRYRREIGTGLPDLTAGFHTYGIDWQPDRLSWYLDGKLLYTVKATTPAEPMYLIANLAVAGRFITDQNPAPATGRTTIDYIRVWQR
jgi:beta-glucanase (GH16 family)